MKRIGNIILIVSLSYIVGRWVVLESRKPLLQKPSTTIDTSYSKGVFLQVDTTGQLQIKGDTVQLTRALLVILDEWNNNNRVK